MSDRAHASNSRRSFKRTCLATTLAVLFTAAGCETPTESPVDVISPGYHIASAETVPFSGTFSGKAKFDPPAAPTRALFEGTGQATHLGATLNMGVLAPLDSVPVEPIATIEGAASGGRNARYMTGTRRRYRPRYLRLVRRSVEADAPTCVPLSGFSLRPTGAACCSTP